MIDIDKLFENYFRAFISENAGKFTEDELEDKVGETYTRFGNSPLKELGGKSPIEYFADMSPKELVDVLNDCVNGDIPVSDYLCDAIEKSDETAKYLIKNVNADVKDELATYSLNILNSKGEFSNENLKYFVKLVMSGEIGESLAESLTETLENYADRVKEEILSVYDADDTNKKYFIEILSETTPPDDRVLNILTDELERGENPALTAAYLTKYGDERVVPYLKDFAERTDNYLDYKEMKLAVEALGGEMEERDFSKDPLFKKLKSNAN